MQENDDEPKQKHPIDMTSDELLDYALAPEVSAEVKRLAKPQEEEPEQREPES